MVEMLLKKGLTSLADLAIEKGEEYVQGLVKDKFGIDISDKNLADEHTEALQHYDIELELSNNQTRDSMFKTQVEDVQDARSLYKENVRQRNKAGEYFMYFLTVLIVLGGGGALIFVTGMDESVREFLKPLVTAFALYWAGSSAGSKMKDQHKHEQQLAAMEQDDGRLF